MHAAMYMWVSEICTILVYSVYSQCITHTAHTSDSNKILYNKMILCSVVMDVIGVVVAGYFRVARLAMQ